jgi:hypothetical protein
LLHIYVALDWNGHKLIISPENANNPVPNDTEPTALARRLAQAHHYLHILESGEYPTITLLAEACGQDPSKLTKILNLVNLSPTIQKMIVEGSVPYSMTLKKLYERISQGWQEQERLYLTYADVFVPKLTYFFVAKVKSAVCQVYCVIFHYEKKIFESRKIYF